jgi:hypothetical protein
LLAPRDDTVNELDQLIREPYRNLFAHTRMVPLRDARAGVLKRRAPLQVTAARRDAAPSPFIPGPWETRTC